MVVFHASGSLAPAGFLGVDVFFVISGFLITSIVAGELDKGVFSFRTFYARRIRRLFPALALVMAVTLAAGWLWYWPDDFKAMGLDAAAGAGFIANLVLWREAGYFDRLAETKPFLHLWSLGVEEQFYLFWPALLVVATRTRFGLRRPIAAVTVVSLACHLYWSSTAPTTAFYVPLARFWELGLGGLLATFATSDRNADASPRLATGWLRNASSAVGVAAIVASCLIPAFQGLPAGLLPLIPTVGCLLVIAAGPSTWLNRCFIGNRVLVYVGLVSYALYLWHWPLFSFLKTRQLASPFALSVAAALSLALAAVTYELLERPLRRATQGGVGLPVTRALAGAIAAVGVFGLAAWRLDGIPQRFPPAVQSLPHFEEASYWTSLEAYRWTRCFGGPQATPKDFPGECVDPVTPTSTAPPVLLWGDSHAAHLSPGFWSLLHNNGGRLAQYTSSGCPPISDVEFQEGSTAAPAPGEIGRTQQCRQLNTFVVGQVRALGIQTVVIAANWANWQDQRSLDQKLARTASSLREAGASKLILVGPVPQWTPSLVKRLMEYAMDHRSAPLPDRMSLGLVQTTWQLDDRMRLLAGAMGADYVSVLQTLCTRDECMTRVPGSTADWMTYDDSHFTPQASNYVVKSLFPGLTS